VIRVRALFAGRLATTPCPAECGGRLDHEPAVLTIASDPFITWISGGDTLDSEQLAAIASRLRDEATGNALPADVRVFSRQAELKTDLYAHLRETAGAFTALNRARAEDALAEYVAREWRSVTPAALVASDVLTLVQRFAEADTSRQLAEAHRFFHAHAVVLGQLQVQSWLAMCHEQARLSPDLPRLRDDLARYVVAGAVFENATEGLAAYARQSIGAADGNPLLTYTVLATLACLHHVSRSENPLASEWTHYWARAELELQEADAGIVAGFEHLRLELTTLAPTLSRHTLFEIAARSLLPLYNAGEDARPMVQRLARLGECGGYDRLVLDVFAQLRLTSDALATADGVMAEIRRSLERGSTTPRAGGAGMDLKDAVALYATTLSEARDVDALVTVFERTRDLAEDDETRAAIEIWFGDTLIPLHREYQLLEHIGAEARPWEDRLSDEMKGRLWNERANALRAAGRRAETLALRERVVPLLAASPGSPNHRTALRNLAIAHREQGAPDRALEILRRLLEDADAPDRPHVLESLAATFANLGDVQRAAAALDEAIELSVGPNALHRARFMAARTAISARERPVDTEPQLIAAPREAWSDFVVLLQECAAWLNMHFAGHEIGKDGIARFRQATDLMARRLGQQNSDLPPHLREAGYLVLAEIAEQFDEGDVQALWDAAAEEADRTGQTPHPAAVLALTQFAYREKRIDDARRILALLPDAMTRDFQRLERIDIALEALTTLGRRFDALIDHLLEEGLGHDARVVAEFRRDPVRQSGFTRTAQDVREVLNGAVIGQVLTDDATAVLEFLETRGSIAAMLTWRPRDSQPAFTLLEWPDGLDVVALRARLLHRLQGWLIDRPGDPFDVRGWGEFRAWIRAALDAVLPLDGHLVVIESETLSGLPFHVAVAPDLTCSYASSWSSLSRHQEAHPARFTSMGFAMVPAFNDDPRVVEAMRAAEARGGEMAARHRLAWSHAADAECDHAALEKLMHTSDVLFIACHGFLDETRHEIAWVLAHKAGLPGRSGSITSGAAHRRTHFSWRDVEGLQRSPRLVLSAACSSGRALLTGLGQRLGLFPSLRRRGTRTMIAPAWDVDANIVLPVATRALELSLDGTRSIAAAVRLACQEASGDMPQWIAWSLTLEGEWR
jgi:tetratricopeptide (TPR) repeat protein